MLPNEVMATTTMASRRTVTLDGKAVPRHDLVRALRKLTGPERDVVELRLGLCGRPATLDETSRQLGMSLEQVRAIEGLALSKLRHPSIGLLDRRRPGVWAA